MKKLLLTSAIGFAILVIPDWPFPRSSLDHWLIFLGYVLWLGPLYLIGALVLNRLANLSFRVK